AVAPVEQVERIRDPDDPEDGQRGSGPLPVWASAEKRAAIEPAPGHHDRDRDHRLQQELARRAKPAHIVQHADPKHGHAADHDRDVHRPCVGGGEPRQDKVRERGPEGRQADGDAPHPWNRAPMAVPSAVRNVDDPETERQGADDRRQHGGSRQRGGEDDGKDQHSAHEPSNSVRSPIRGPVLDRSPAIGSHGRAGSARSGRRNECTADTGSRWRPERPGRAAHPRAERHEATGWSVAASGRTDHIVLPHGWQPRTVRPRSSGAPCLSAASLVRFPRIARCPPSDRPATAVSSESCSPMRSTKILALTLAFPILLVPDATAQTPAGTADDPPGACRASARYTATGLATHSATYLAVAEVTGRAPLAPNLIRRPSRVRARPVCDDGGALPWRRRAEPAPPGVVVVSAEVRILPATLHAEVNTAYP